MNEENKKCILDSEQRLLKVATGERKLVPSSHSKRTSKGYMAKVDVIPEILPASSEFRTTCGSDGCVEDETVERGRLDDTMVRRCAETGDKVAFHKGVTLVETCDATLSATVLLRVTLLLTYVVRPLVQYSRSWCK